MTRATGRNSFRNLISRNKSLLFLVAIAITANVEEWNVIPDSSPISSLVGFAEAFAAGGFGGGGGGGGGFGSAKGKAGTKKSKKKKKRQSLVEITEASTTATKKNVGTANTPTPDTNQPKLDKWGLPVAALEDIFPPLPESTKLDPVDSSKDHYELSEIQNLLKDHVDLGDLNRIFDDQGVAKIPNEDGSTMRLRVLHESPPVLALDNFLTRDECQDVKRVAENEMSTHRVDSATFKGALSTRTSTSWFCQYSAVPMLVAKAHYILGVPLETMEEPQIVRYKGGEEFSWHYDEVPSPQLSNGGQRVATLLVYLTTVPSSRGGGTTFRDLKESSSSSSSLVMQPERGSALLFFPSFADGTPDDRTLHKSEILVGNNNNNNNNENENTDSEDGRKWIVQMWTHQHDYQAALPFGNSNKAARDIMEKTGSKLGYNSCDDGN
mmetsp:Transcript_701/g.1671  ORF Transcript_701/g.1671 Transcript_701/m.1671 type:complete len:438 (+) Transcript_701:91-1404(+)